MHSLCWATSNFRCKISFASRFANRSGQHCISHVRQAFGGFRPLGLASFSGFWRQWVVVRASAFWCVPSSWPRSAGGGGCFYTGRFGRRRRVEEPNRSGVYDCFRSMKAQNHAKQTLQCLNPRQNQRTTLQMTSVKLKSMAALVARKAKHAIITTSSIIIITIMAIVTVFSLVVITVIITFDIIVTTTVRPHG